MFGDGNVLTLVGMLAVVALILAAAYYATRWIGSHGVPGPVGSGDFQILRQLSLGRDARLLLLRAGKQYLLLGVTPSAVTLLRELTEEEAQAWDGTERHAPPSFMEALRQSMEKKKK